MAPKGFDVKLDEQVSGWGRGPGQFLSDKETIHHLGFVVSSIARVANVFAASMSLRWDGQIIHDPIQRVRVSFLHPADPLNPVYELVESAGENSPVNSFLRKGGGLHHVCYETDELDLMLGKTRGTGFDVVARPTPAAAFDGRRIAWVCSRNRLVMELLERSSK